MLGANGDAIFALRRGEQRLHGQISSVRRSPFAMTFRVTVLTDRWRYHSAGAVFGRAGADSRSPHLHLACPSRLPAFCLLLERFGCRRENHHTHVAHHRLVLALSNPAYAYAFINYYS